MFKRSVIDSDRTRSCRVECRPAVHRRAVATSWCTFSVGKVRPTRFLTFNSYNIYLLAVLLCCNVFIRSAASKLGDFAPRSGFFFLSRPGDVHVCKWDPATETLLQACDMDPEDVMRIIAGAWLGCTRSCILLVLGGNHDTVMGLQITSSTFILYRCVRVLL